MAIVDGWGRGTWGQGAWDENIPVEVTGQQLTLNLNSVTIVATQNQTVLVTGEELIKTLEGVAGIEAGGNVQVPVLAPLETVTEGVVEIIIDGSTSLTGQQLTANLNSVTALANADVDVTGITLTTTLGSVDPGPDVAVTGQQLNSNLNSVNIAIFQDGFVNVTGQELTASLNSVTVLLDTPVDVVGLPLTMALNSVTITLNTPVDVTGNALTISLNSINNQIWTVVNTGTPATWTEIDTAA
jgi:hypothetical protein